MCLYIIDKIMLLFNYNRIIKYSSESNWCKIVNNYLNYEYIKEEIRIARYNKIISIQKLLISLFVEIPIVVIFYLLIGFPNLIFKILTFNILYNTNNSNINKYIVLIHGLGANNINWLVIEVYIKIYLYYKNYNKKNKIGLIIINYNSFQSLLKSCDDIINQINNNNKNNKDIILIGYSLGALLARSLKHHPKYKNSTLNIKQIFLINGILKGVPIINYLCDNNIYNNEIQIYNDIKINSKFMNELNNNIKKKYNDEFNNNIYEIIGLNDIYLDPCLAISNINNKNIYKSYGGHYFNSVNPYVWFKFIFNKIK